MEPQLKNKMTNILCSISLIKNLNLDTLNLTKEIIEDNRLDKSVERDIMKQINEANNPTDLVDVLKEIVSSEKTAFETFFKTIEKNINQEEQRIHNKNEMVERLSSFLQTIKQAFENKSISVSDIAAEIKTQSSLIDTNYKENARKSFTKKWLTSIKGLEYNRDSAPQYQIKKFKKL